MGSLLSSLRTKAWRTKGTLDDWEVVSDNSVRGLELYPRRLATNDNSSSVKFDQSVQVVNSIEELAAGKTWLLIRRGGDEDYVMAWSPCSGERLMLHVKVLDELRTGLLLAPGSGYSVGVIDLVLDYEEQVLYAMQPGAKGTWCFSSLRGQWEVIQEQEQDVPVDELGKTYHILSSVNPKHKICKKLPSPAEIGVHYVNQEWHWYAGSLYAMGCDHNTNEGSLLVFRWDSDSWTQVASHAMYSVHCLTRECGDVLFVEGGGRYLWATQGSEKASNASHFLVVYDLEEDIWHYRTIQAYCYMGFIDVFACNKGYTGTSLLNVVFSAVWKNDPCQLPLPPLP